MHLSKVCQVTLTFLYPSLISIYFFCLNNNFLVTEYARKKKTGYKWLWSYLLYPLTRTRSTALVLLPKSSVRIFRFWTVLAQSRPSARLSLHSSDLLLPQPPHLQASVYPTPFWFRGGGHTRLRERGRVPIRTSGHTLWYSRYTRNTRYTRQVGICTLWALDYSNPNNMRHLMPCLHPCCGFKRQSVETYNFSISTNYFRLGWQFFDSIKKESRLKRELLLNLKTLSWIYSSS